MYTNILYKTKLQISMYTCATISELSSKIRGQYTVISWPAWFDDPGHKVVQIVAGDAVAVRERVPGGGQGSLPPAQESMIKLVMEFIELNWSNEKS